MGTMPYVTQVPEGCFLCHLTGEEAKNFNPKLFTVVSRITLNISHNLAAELNIIGESHIVRVFNNGIPVFIEILSCVDPRDKGLTCASHSFARKPHHIVYGDEFDTVAQINPPIMPADRHAFEPVSPDEPLFTSNLALEFPGKLKPRTMLMLSVYSDRLVWSSLHEYEKGRELTPLTSTTAIWLDGWD